jgi:hypothetical protein
MDGDSWASRRGRDESRMETCRSFNRGFGPVSKSSLKHCVGPNAYRGYCERLAKEPKDFFSGMRRGFIYVLAEQIVEGYERERTGGRMRGEGGRRLLLGP